MLLLLHWCPRYCVYSIICCIQYYIVYTVLYCVYSIIQYCIVYTVLYIIIQYCIVYTVLYTELRQSIFPHYGNSNFQVRKNLTIYWQNCFKICVIKLDTYAKTFTLVSDSLICKKYTHCMMNHWLWIGKQLYFVT